MTLDPSGPRLVLLDIDGTLLSATRLSRGCLLEALEEVFGRAVAVDGYDFAGKTDPQIVRELTRAAGLPAEDVERGFPRALAAYAARLTARLRDEDVRAKPGAVALVEALHAHPRVTLGLLTGNLEPCARAKLAPLGVNGRFAFGAFGSDDEDRYRLPALAVERAFAATGRRFAGRQVVVVGDSVHDVRCGRSLDVRAVAVATGPTPEPLLRAAAPDALLSDFRDTAAALRAILD